MGKGRRNACRGGYESSCGSPMRKARKAPCGKPSQSLTAAARVLVTLALLDVRLHLNIYCASQRVVTRVHDICHTFSGEMLDDEDQEEDGEVRRRSHT